MPFPCPICSCVNSDSSTRCRVCRSPITSAATPAELLVRELAASARERLQSEGIPTGSRPVDVAILDLLIDEELSDRDDRRIANDTPPFEQCLGAYYGEILHAFFGGRWETSRTASQTEETFLSLRNGTRVEPFLDVHARFRSTGSTLWKRFEALSRSLTASPAGEAQQSSSTSAPSDWITAAETFRTRGSPLSALSLADRARESDSAIAGLETLEARCHLDLAEFREAVSASRRAIKRNPGDAAAWGILAETQARMGEVQEALKTIDHLIAEDPNQASAWETKGAIYARAGKPRDALFCYTRALSIQPRSGSLHLAKARALRGLALPDESLFALREAVGHEPGNADAWLEASELLEAKGRLEEAARSAATALRHVPLSTAAIFWKSNLDERLGHHAEAIRGLKRVVLLTPADSDHSRKASARLAERRAPAPSDDERRVALARLRRTKGVRPSVRTFIDVLYETGPRLGDGSSDRTQLAWCRATGDPVVLTRVDIFDSRVLTQTCRDLEAWAHVPAHPFIGVTRGFDVVGDTLIVESEVVAPISISTQDLPSSLLSRRPSLEQTVIWSIQLCRALESAFAAGIREHGNIRFSNLLPDGAGNLWLVDPARATQLRTACHATADGAPPVSSILDEHTVSRLVAIGEISAPELFLTPLGNQLSDIYAFGAAIQRLLSGGSPPIEAVAPPASWQDVSRFWNDCRKAHASKQLELDSPLEALVRRCMAVSPERRYATFAELRRELEAFFSGLTGEAGPVEERQNRIEAAAKNRSVAFHLLGKGQKAMETVDEALLASPGSADLHELRGDFLSNAGSHAEASNSYCHAIALDPDSVDRLSKLATSLSRAGDHRGAAESYGAIVRLEPQNTSSWIARAAELDRAGLTLEALESIDHALAINPAEAALQAKIDLLRKAGRTSDLVATTALLLDLDESRSSAWSARALALAELRRPEEAISAASRAIELEPLAAEPWLAKGLAFLQLSCGREATEALRKAASLKPASGTTWFAIGKALVVLQDDRAAVKCFDEAAEHSQDRRGHVEALLEHAAALARLGRDSDAITSLASALRLEPASKRATELRQELLGRLKA